MIVIGYFVMIFGIGIIAVLLLVYMIAPHTRDRKDK